MSFEDNTTIIREGETCWKKAHVDRGSVIIGGRNYFRAFREAVLAAEKRVVILAWELHTEVLLLRGEDQEKCDDGYPFELGAFLNAVLDDRPELEIYILLWDFSPIYAGEREWPSFNKNLKDSHPRLHFALDDQLPATASHHQKVVVVDDSLAFTGGIDLSIWRWDTNESIVNDDRRTTPDGESYHPYHDTHMAVTGDMAKVLRDLCLNRWERATGKELEKLAGSRDIWPQSLEVDFEDETACLARTYSKFEPHDAIFEIEKMHIAAIESAKDFIYIENQYYSCPRINKALIKQLEDPDGPVVVLVLNKSAGWLENYTLGVVRDRLLDKLSRAPEDSSRLRILYPYAEQDGDSNAIYVHSKVLIVDNRFIKVGSSNLSNRSMRVDSEVDIAFESEQSKDWIKNTLDRLLAVHYQIAPEKVNSSSRLTDTIDELETDQGNRLRELPFSCKSLWKKALADSKLLDPDEPIDPGHWVQKTVPENDRTFAMKRIGLIAGTLVLAIVLALLLQNGWGNLFNEQKLTGWLESVQNSPASILILIAIFIVAGMIGFPLNLLLVAAVTVFGPWTGLLCGVSGALVSSFAGFGLGRLWGRPLLEKWNSEKIERINNMLQNRSPVSVAVIRLIPVAPFVVVNLVAGASKLHFRVYAAGTLLGMLPGMAGVVWLTSSIGSVIRNPGWVNIAGLVLAVAAVASVMMYLKKSLTARPAHS